MENNGNLVSVDFFQSLLKETFVKKPILDCYVLGNSLSISFEDHTLEIDPAWRLIYENRVLVGSADIGHEESEWSDEERQAYDKLEKIVRQICLQDIESIVFNPCNDICVSFGQGLMLQNFNSSTSRDGNVSIRNSDCDRSYILSGNFIKKLI